MTELESHRKWGCWPTPSSGRTARSQSLGGLLWQHFILAHNCWDSLYQGALCPVRTGPGGIQGQMTAPVGLPHFLEHLACISLDLPLILTVNLRRRNYHYPLYRRVIWGSERLNHHPRLFVQGWWQSQDLNPILLDFKTCTCFSTLWILCGSFPSTTPAGQSLT